MSIDQGRRDFLRAAAGMSLAPGASLLGGMARGEAQSEAIRAMVWDERQPAQKQAYENFLGNQIAEHLRKQAGLSVQSVALDDPQQGLSEETLDKIDVLIWWGHVRQAEVTPETGKRIVARILAGKLSLIALHSAHWSTPFVEAMNERTRQVTERDYPGAEITYIAPPKRYTVPSYEARPTPFAKARKFPDGKQKVEVHLPYCCFPAYRNDGKPSKVRILKPNHPIAEGLPPSFEISQTEMYDEPFHIPEPDEVVIEECWAPGEWFRSGMVWNLGKGRVFYFRPGHETFPVFKEAAPLQILTNAVRWLANR